MLSPDIPVPISVLMNRVNYLDDLVKNAQNGFLVYCLSFNEGLEITYVWFSHEDNCGLIAENLLYL